MNELDAKALLTSVLQIAGSSADQEARVTSMAILVELVEMYYYYLPEFLDSICKVTQLVCTTDKYPRSLSKRYKALNSNLKGKRSSYGA